jgi:ABC-type phosphate/phosphonate transport system ATPase subunit
MDVEVRELGVHFPQRATPALAGVDLTIDAGEHVALLGVSGSGKTTLLRCLVGAVTPTSGSVRIGGVELTQSRQAQRLVRRRTGIIRQRDDLVRGMRAQTNALIGTSWTWGVADWLQVVSGRVPQRYRQPLAALATRHGVDAYLTSRVEDLSGGQRQRIALVRALLNQPQLLLADEPTSGLDPVTAHLAVTALQGVTDATVIVTTHDISVARRFPRVIALRAGSVIFDGPLPGDSDIAAFYEPVQAVA